MSGEAGEALLPPRKVSEPLTLREKIFGCGGLIPKAFRLPLMVIVWVVVGVATFMKIEGFGITTAIYVVAQIVTTVGYGDVTVRASSQHMKLFLGFYCLFGVAVAAELVNEICNYLITATEDRARTKMRAIEASLMDGGTEEETWLTDHKVQVNKAVAAFGLWTLCIIFGTGYFGFLDNCVCADGIKPCEALQWSDKGCPEDEQRTLVDAFYMCCITLTTIGFGDQAPQTKIGRGIAVVWMLVGVAATANFISSCSDLFLEDKKRLKALNRNLYEEMDKDDEGRIHKWQFLKFMLLRYDLCKQEDLDFVMEQFHALDADNSGKLTLADLPSRASAKSKLHAGMKKIRAQRALSSGGK